MNQQGHPTDFGPLPPLPQQAESIQPSVEKTPAPGKPRWWWIGRYALPVYVASVCFLAAITGATGALILGEDFSTGVTFDVITFAINISMVPLVVPCLIFRSNGIATIVAGILLVFTWLITMSISSVVYLDDLQQSVNPWSVEIGAAARLPAIPHFVLLLLSAGFVALIDVLKRKPANWGFWLTAIILTTPLLAVGPGVYLITIARRHYFPAGREVPLLGVGATITASSLGIALCMLIAFLVGPPEPPPKAREIFSQSISETTTEPRQTLTPPPRQQSTPKRGPLSADAFSVTHEVVGRGPYGPAGAFIITCRSTSPVTITGFDLNGQGFSNKAFREAEGAGVLIGVGGRPIKFPFEMKIGDTRAVMPPYIDKQTIYFDIHTTEGSIRYTFQ